MGHTMAPKNQPPTKHHQGLLPYQISLAITQTLWTALNPHHNWHILAPDIPYHWERDFPDHISGMQV
jgi:hypothetical protein